MFNNLLIFVLELSKENNIRINFNNLNLIMTESWIDDPIELRNGLIQKKNVLLNDGVCDLKLSDDVSLMCIRLMCKDHEIKQRCDEVFGKMGYKISFYN